MSSLKSKAIAEFIILLAAVLPAAVYSAVVDVWAVSDGEKVFRYDSEHRSRESNSIWDGTTIRLRGLYNEVLAFQVIAVADSEGARSVEMTVGAPLHRGSVMAIGAFSPRLYGPGAALPTIRFRLTRPRRPPSLMDTSSPAAR